MRYLLISVIFIIASPVWAAAHPRDSESQVVYNKCMAKENTNHNLGQCTGSYFDHLDAILNKYWSDAMSYEGKPESAKQAIMNEQHKWIAFKDSSCFFWHHVARDIHFPLCRAKIIESRNKFLIEVMSVGLSSMMRMKSDDFLCSGKKDPKSIKICSEISEHFKKSDDELNRVWREMRAKWDEEDYPEVWKALLNEQRKWVALKESACQYYSEESSKIDCISGMTERRIDDLKKYLDFEF